MKAASVHELKDELRHQSQAQLVELCSRLARFKKENKELLTYLLFEAHDEAAYVNSVKNHTAESFAAIPLSNSLYLQKKSVRKILREVNKYVRYTGSKSVEVQLQLHFCQALKQSGINWRESPALQNLFQNIQNKIQKILPTLHEDAQYDFRRFLEAL